MIKKILGLVSNSNKESIFTKEQSEKIESVIKLHLTRKERRTIMKQPMFKIIEEIHFVTGVDLLSEMNLIFKRKDEMFQLDKGYITELDNPKKGSGVFINLQGIIGYYYIKKTKGKLAYIELCDVQPNLNNDDVRNHIL